MTEATSDYLNQPRRTEAEAKAGRMVTLQLTVGELEYIDEGLEVMRRILNDALAELPVDHKAFYSRIKRADALRDRINTAIQEALS